MTTLNRTTSSRLTAVERPVTTRFEKTEIDSNKRTENNEIIFKNRCADFVEYPVTGCLHDSSSRTWGKGGTRWVSKTRVSKGARRRSV